MSKRITIDPVTRLEGHGKIDIFLDDRGDFERACFQVPDFKGFEKFCEGRAVEEMPTLTQKICGVCPTAHHIASSKALDDLFAVTPPPAARKNRELMHNAFMYEDHLLHFYFLGGPDFLVDSGTPISRRNILGVIDKMGIDFGKQVMDIRRRVRGVNAAIGGSPLFPVCGLPGGISKPLTSKEKTEIQAVAKDAVTFAQLSLKIFQDVFLNHKQYVEFLNSDVFRHRTYYMGLVDEHGRVNFYDGKIRVVDPDGRSFAEFEARDYLNRLEERVVPWSYLKVLYLKEIGWKGFVDGAHSGIYRVGPLARLNAADGMATPLAQAEYEKMYAALGGKPVHNTMAYYWARLIEVLYAAERMEVLAADEKLTDPNVRTIPDQISEQGIGVCEAPRGTLIHHYQTDRRGIVQKLNLLVATQNNAAAISMSIEKAARHFIKEGQITEEILNLVEMAYRAYDPCLACATH
ncbi:MAG: Ni/Fe hydrogenase subunit alpha [Proteobacteria bacterium]|nr:Ni/Fe hydrogenase subunit alpha [Pseudomonadota bacterium]